MDDNTPPKFKRPSEFALTETYLNGDIPVEEYQAWLAALPVYDAKLKREIERTKEYKKSAGGPETL